MKPLVIIGTGLAGYMLAKEWRKYDSQTPLIMLTQSEGHFYSKPLLSTALANKKSPPELITNTKEEMAEKLNATIMTKAVVSKIDTQRQKIYVDQAEIDYQQLVLATGAAVNLPLLERGGEHLLSVNHIEDYRDFRQQLVGKKKITIIGAGLVGCEFANDLVMQGFDVSVVEYANQPVPRFLPEVVARHLQTLLTAAGVHWYFDQQVQSITALEQGYRLQLNNQQLEADLVLSAIGLKPNIALAKSANIVVNRGIQTNQYLQTSTPDVYALGDCAETEGQVQLFVAPILNAARALAKTLTGELTAVMNPIMPVVLKTAVCPLAVVAPPANLKVRWEQEVDANDVRALAFADGQLVGFAVSGKFARERPQLVKEITENLSAKVIT